MKSNVIKMKEYLPFCRELSAFCIVVIMIVVIVIIVTVILVIMIGLNPIFLIVVSMYL